MLLGVVVLLWLTSLASSTTICALVYGDGVVLGADSRSTVSALVVNKETRKIRLLAPNCALAGAGVSAECSYVARRLQEALALARVDEELCGEPELPHARRVLLLARRLLTAAARGRESVHILGCVSEGLPLLFQISSDGAHEEISFGAFGSGYLAHLAHIARGSLTLHVSLICDRSMEALAVLELANGKRPVSELSESEAVATVRAAVRAGILNDLGSGSHVDICVIDRAQGTRQWRERLKVSEIGASTEDSELPVSSLGTLVYSVSQSESQSLIGGLTSKPLPWMHVNVERIQ